MTDARRAGRSHVLLIGMMGSGKSSVGRALAARTGWPFLDNDALVERATGRTAKELADDGEAALRAAESGALHAGVSVAEPSIIGVAGGALMDDDDRRLVGDGGFVVWLRANPDVLASRAVGGDHRPWLDDDPVGWFRARDAERARQYAEVADLEIDTGVTTPTEAADAIVAAMAERDDAPLPSGS
jgi:shikimate kinase